MLNISTGEVFADNLKVATPDPLLGTTAVAVYESWATELGVSLTATLGTEFTPRLDSSYHFSFDLGFNPFVNINSRIYITSAGNICFYSVNSSDVDINYGGYLYNNLTINGELWGNIRLNAAASLTPILTLTIKDNKTAWETMVAGGRFQSNGIDAIIYMKWGDTNVALKFNSTTQSLDIYVEPLNPIAIIGSMVLDYTVDIANNDIITSTVQQGTVNYPVLQTFGTVNRFTIGTRPLATISGDVREGAGNPIIRRVAAINQATLEVKDTTFSDSAGDFTLKVDPLVDYMVVCIDDEPNPKNALIFDRVNVAL